MRLLHLTPELPYAPGGSGGSTRQFQLLRRLRELGHEVDVVAPVHPTQAEGPAILDEAGIRLFGKRRPESRVRETLAALCRRPGLIPAAARMPVMAWQVEVMVTALVPALRRALAERPDVIAIEHDWAAALARWLPAGVPRVLTLENLSWAYYEARARATSSLTRRGLLRLEGRRFARFDRRHLPSYDLLVTMSEEEHGGLRTVIDEPVVAIPNGVDCARLPAASPDPDQPRLLFVGTLAYPPNAEGAEWLVREVWPRVHAACPAARLEIVGRGASDALQGLADDRVRLPGFVPDIAESYARASVVVVPLLSGAGTKLKLLEGLASGRPVVSTPVGAEGVSVRNGEHVVIADPGEPFAAAIVALLNDPDRRRALATAGRRLVEERYDWRVLGDRYAEALVALTD
jgi:glycosyltransferase involved in cell wall biosynthesis